MFHMLAPRLAGATPRRVGRSFEQLGAALRVAATMSRQRFDYVEVRDDANQLHGYAHKGEAFETSHSITESNCSDLLRSGCHLPNKEHLP
jgi:hypothetical protein